MLWTEQAGLSALWSSGAIYMGLRPMLVWAHLLRFGGFRYSGILCSTTLESLPLLWDSLPLLWESVPLL